MKNVMKKVTSLLMVSVMAISVAGCGSKAASSGTSSSKNAKKVTLAIRQDLTPNSYVDENGKPAGQNIEVAQLVDELLDDYEFEYEAVDADSILVGLDTGKYAAGLANYFYTDERAQKYVFPKKNISAGVLGFIVKKNLSDIDSYEKCAEKGLKLVPKPASDAVYATIKQYNDANPNKTVNCETVGEKIAVGEAMKMVMEGRYDGCVFLKSNYDSVKKQVDANDELTFVPFTSIKTWVLFGKDDQELADAFDKAMETLEQNGKLTELSNKYYGEDVYKY